MSTYDLILASLRAAKADFRCLEHPPEGQTVRASQIRGNPLEQAAKSMVLMVKGGQSDSQLLLAVLSGHRRIDFESLRRNFAAKSIGLADKKKAEEISGCKMGAVPPFTFHPDIEIVVDPELLTQEEIVFNAGRLDVSIFLKTADYIAIANPKVMDLACRPSKAICL